MSGGFHKLRDLLNPVGGRLGFDGALETGVLWSRWSEIVGEGIAAHAEPTSLKQGILRVRTDSPSWATEIGYLTDEIRTRANALAGRAIVAEVRVWTSPEPVRRGAAQSPPGATDADSGTSREELVGGDPIDALEAARAAWSKRHSRGSSRPS